MRRWLESLPINELIEALQFPLDDTLLEMVRLHPPPPTPIHGAVFRGRDGRLRSLERRRAQRDRPRLFQYYEGRVLARKKEGLNGEKYSLPCTRDQQEADEGLLRATVIKNQPQDAKSLISIDGRRVASVNQLLRWLHVASRGYFLSQGPPRKEFQLPTWLKPEERWNTLAFHLVARFECALWSSFHGKMQSPTGTIREDDDPTRWLAACKAALQLDFFTEVPSFAERTTIFNLIEMSSFFIESSGSIWKRPLLELFTDTDVFRIRMQHHYRERLAKEAEQDLLAELANEKREQEKLSPGKKRRRHKRRQGDKKIALSPIAVSSPTQAIGGEDTSSSIDDESANQFDVSALLPLIASTDTTPAGRLRNRNNIICLSIMDDVIEDVLTRVEKKHDTPRMSIENKGIPLQGGTEEAAIVEVRVPLNETAASVKEGKKNADIKSNTNHTLKRKNTIQSPASIWAAFPGVNLGDNSHPTTVGSTRSATSNPQSHTSMFHWPAPLDITWDDFVVDPSRSGCAHSEINVCLRDDELDSRHANHEAENISSTNDDATTITSAETPKQLEHASSQLREERDAYRDLCLTLGAEVSKLKNLLAAQRGLSSMGPFDPFTVTPHATILFDPDSVARFALAAPKARTLGAMSETGYRTDYESLASEDEPTGKLIGSRQMSATVAGSDLSVELSATHLGQPSGVCIPSSKDLFDPVSANRMQSRLSNDMMSFVDSINVQLRKQRLYRQKAIDRISRLVTALWPRAQVKLYGSHVSGLCLPLSDLDFVVCLPAVHKNAPAQTAGALEGRNAINETSHKLLARKLKSESWIDPRSLKLIERTAVPVIKVATKDTRARTLQLDISFDGPGHQGLAANDMVNLILQELPMTKPLVLILKQFLNDRGLLTAYTGGLSSYGLFLLVARYLQEQHSPYGDAGSLLMGFLDFYGNHFDPRTTGVSVKHRMYFPRPNLARIQAGQIWNQHTFVQIQRRNSFNDRGHHVQHLAGVVNEANQFPTDHGMSYNLDPLLIEDPLSTGNNVGRNAFRIFQIQRAFSDAHRALVAALEWDMQSNEESDEYPLLKSLLHNEDTVVEI